MIRGFSSDIRSKPHPQPAITRGEYDSATTSHHPSSRSTTSRPAALVGSAVTLRLPMLTELKNPLESKTPSWNGENPSARPGSARDGHSTFTTSAPSAASAFVGVAPATFHEKSSTLDPDNGLNVMGRVPRKRNRNGAQAWHRQQ